MRTDIVLPFPVPPSALVRGTAELLELGPRRLRIQIPAGTAPGQRLRLRGLGDALGPAFMGSDLLLRIEHAPEATPARDLWMDLRLTRTELLEARTQRLHLGERQVDLRVPPGLRSGQVLRMRGAAQSLNGGYPGDLLLRVVEQSRMQHLLQGLFLGFVVSPSEQKVQVELTLPYLLKISSEWVFHSTPARLAAAPVQGR